MNKKIKLFIGGAIYMFASVANADYSYSYSGLSYTNWNTNYDANLWSRDGNITFSFTVQNELTANATNVLSSIWTSWKISDGTHTLDSVNNPDAFTQQSTNFAPFVSTIAYPAVMTDNNRNIIHWSITANSNNSYGGALQLITINCPTNTCPYTFDETLFDIGGDSKMANSWNHGRSGTWNKSVVATVPVPTAAWLLGSGLLGLIGVARRKAA